MATVRPSVGSIVWVRRRNGSWWPGKILSVDELSDTHLMSPRSGTPVKLLGREDASVDWYNLERSKRVKAFRCGDFDEHIEKVKCSHEIHLKKREKYARREDAILHALELEKEMLEKKHGKLGRELETVVACSKSKRRSRCVYSPIESDRENNNNNSINPGWVKKNENADEEDDNDSGSSSSEMRTSGNQQQHRRHWSPISSKWILKRKRNARHGPVRRLRQPLPPLRDFSSDAETACFYDSEENNNISCRRRKPVLFDVDLKVQASYQEQIPIVSLLSKYNGNAIIGRSVPVEVLPFNSSFAGETSTVIPPVWKTARRTLNFRVPRPISTTTTTAAYAVAAVDDLMMLRKAKTGFGRKQIFGGGQKIRTLSSIKGYYYPPNNNVVRPENAIPADAAPSTAFAACIPVGLIYTRLFEAISRSK